MYKFDNSHYERSHGKAPKGRGAWAFEVNGKVDFIWGGITLAQAKKNITAILKAQGVPAGTVIYVAP